MQMFYVANLKDDYMLLGMPFLSAKNPKIDWTNRIFRERIEAWTPNVHYRPFLNLAISATQMKEMLHSQFINYKPESQNKPLNLQLLQQQKPTKPNDLGKN
jgi:hypothetical protein